MSGHEDVERVSWEEAERLLAAALPGVRSFHPDEVIEAAQQIGLPVSLERVRGWRRLTDRQLFDRTFEGAPAYRGRLLVWNPYVGYSSTPAVIHASQLAAFVANHATAYGEDFFSGDVLILGLDDGAIFLFHHAGLFAHVHRPSS